MARAVIFTHRRVGTYVRLHGKRVRLVSVDKNLTRVLKAEDCDAGGSWEVSDEAWVDLAQGGDLTEDVKFAAEAHVDKLVEQDWDALSRAQQWSAMRRLPFFRRMDEKRFDPYQRRQRDRIQSVVDEVHLETGLPKISVESFRSFDTRYLTRGKDPRALADLNHLKGNRSDPDNPSPHAWIDDFIEKNFPRLMLATPRLKVKEAAKILQSEVAVKAADEELPLPPGTTQGRAFGHFRPYRLWQGHNYFEHKINEVGIKAGIFHSKGTAKGPEPDRPLLEVESDHTMLDILLVDEAGNVMGRAWLTTIFDRYSRQILGFYITYEAPSWQSLLQAILVCMRAKGPLLASAGYDFRYEMKCHGAFAKLFVDRGPEFLGKEIVAFAQLLGTRLYPLPRASGNLKGKVERNYGTVNHGFISRLQGRTTHRPDKRIHEDAMPRMTIKQLNRLFVIWWVDEYQNTMIRDVGKPRLLYESKMIGTGYDRLPPPESLIGAMEAPVRTLYLTSAGVRVDGFDYHSDELRQLLHDLGTEQHVIGRVDPNNGDIVRVFDSKNRVFVEARLTGKYYGTQLRRAELISTRKSDLDTKQSKGDYLLEHRARKGVNDEIDKLNNRDQQRLPDTSLPRTHRAEHIERAIYSPDASGAPLGSHDETVPIEPNSYDIAGNYQGPGIVKLAMEGKIEARQVPGKGNAPKENVLPFQASGGYAPPAAPAPAPKKPAPPASAPRRTDDEESW